MSSPFTKSSILDVVASSLSLGSWEVEIGNTVRKLPQFSRQRTTQEEDSVPLTKAILSRYLEPTPLDLSHHLSSRHEDEPLSCSTISRLEFVRIARIRDAYSDSSECKAADKLFHNDGVTWCKSNSQINFLFWNNQSARTR